MKIFLSYGHDQNTPIVLRIKQDLETAGHTVWIDSSEIKTGDNWRRSIIDGLTTTDCTLGFLSRHSTRDPGVCLDELAIALHVKNGTIATILVESEAAANPPVSVSQIQWLDMHEWAARQAEGAETFEAWYQPKLKEILAVLNSPGTRRFAGEIRDLERLLRPISQDADIGALVDSFMGREWLRAKLDEWRRNSPGSRLFWVSGGPGTGKSAFAAWLAHLGHVNVIGINLCRYNIDERRDPNRVLCTLAFQIATRLPDYRRLLLDQFKKQDPRGEELGKRSTAALFDWLLAEPLRLGIDGGRRSERYLVIIDALDETIRDGRSVLAEVLAESAQKLPAWIAIVVTGRPEPSIVRQFSGLNTQMIAAESAENVGDLRAYARHWLTRDSLGGGELDARVERVVAASQGNFLYLRMLQDAVSQGSLSLAHPDGLPQGVVGLYERWLRRLFPNPAAYEAYVPLIEVLVGADHPIPESWLEHIFGWSKREGAKLIEGLGSLFERRKDGIAPFHKGFRDWLTDDRTAGADFVVDVAAGKKRLTAALWTVFIAWTEQVGEGQFDDFCESELISQLTGMKSEAGRLPDLTRRLADTSFIHRKMLIGTDASEDSRRAQRHRLRAFVNQLAGAWPRELAGSGLWAIVETLNKAAWDIVDTLPDLHKLVIWDDIGRPQRQWDNFKDELRAYDEWNEGVLLLVTTMDAAFSVVRARPDLAPGITSIMDRKLLTFLETQAYGFVEGMVTGTAGRDYIPERNLSFLESPVRDIYQLLKNDPRLAAWSKDWFAYFKS